MESCVPPGFRFHPTDEELVGYYLKKKVASQKIDFDVIRVIDLYQLEPWDLQERCRIGYEQQNEWYFFSYKDKKFPTGMRTNRATMAGFWKATGRDKVVYNKSKLIGLRKTLVFYIGRAPNGQKTDWIIHEYRLESDENGSPQEEDWAVCRAFKKRTKAESKNLRHWNSGYLYSKPSTTGVSTEVTDQVAFSPRHYHRSFFTTNNLLNPQLKHNPSSWNITIPAISKTLVSYTSDNSNNNNDTDNANKDKDHDQIVGGDGNNKVIDWRTLDKFVAAQFSRDEGCPYHHQW